VKSEKKKTKKEGNNQCFGEARESPLSLPRRKNRGREMISGKVFFKHACGIPLLPRWSLSEVEGRVGEGIKG
jgi:hypothetical protein